MVAAGIGVTLAGFAIAVSSLGMARRPTAPGWS